jgi:hypothetical protein
MGGARGYVLRRGRIRELRERYLALEFKDRTGPIVKVLLDYLDEVPIAFYEL